MSYEEQVTTHNNGVRSYRVDITKGENDKYYTVKLAKFHEKSHDYEHIKEWNTVKCVYTGEQNASVLFQVIDPKFEDQEGGFTKLIHVYNDRTTLYRFCPQDSIAQYHSDVTDADVVLAYMVTSSGKLYVFDDHSLLIIKNPPQLAEIQADFWTWYYKNYSIQTFGCAILDVAETHSRD